MKEYITIQQDSRSELDIKKSRFICHLKRVESEEEARDFIAAIKKEHFRANHNCSAFILGENQSIKRSSDDGEPSGTAGVPILTVLEKQAVTNVVAVVTRYFGGIKLGAGGLIRAYAGAVAHALEETRLVEIKEQVGLELTLTYTQYQDFLNWRTEKDLEEYDTQFLTEVTTTIYVNEEVVSDIRADLTDRFHGTLSLREQPSRIVEVPLS